MIAGVGNVVVFVPADRDVVVSSSPLLEDFGYLARVAFVIDRLMGRVGLHGKAFVPMLSGFACAIPAVMATRTIEGRRDRLITMLTLPMISCSARLPVYALVTAVVFAGAPRVFGILSAGAVVLFSMYALSVVRHPRGGGGAPPDGAARSPSSPPARAAAVSPAGLEQRLPRHVAPDAQVPGGRRAPSS